MRFQQVKTLLAQGQSHRQVAQQTGLALGTVRKYASLETCPVLTHRPPRRRKIDAHLEWLTGQLQQGPQNARTLFEALRGRGYQGGASVVRQVCRQWRQEQTQGCTRPSAWRTPAPTAKRLTWAVLCPEHAPSELHRLLESCRTSLPLFSEVETLVQVEWRVLRRQTPVEQLRPWLTQLQKTTVPELRSLALGLDRDFDAVQAAVEWPWSNGPVEVHVNRLKTLKRTMYGRAGLPLLTARALYWARG